MSKTLLSACSIRALAEEHLIRRPFRSDAGPDRAITATAGIALGEVSRGELGMAWLGKEKCCNSGLESGAVRGGWQTIARASDENRLTVSRTGSRGVLWCRLRGQNGAFRLARADFCRIIRTRLTVAAGIVVLANVVMYCRCWLRRLKASDLARRKHFRRWRSVACSVTAGTAGRQKANYVHP